MAHDIGHLKRKALLEHIRATVNSDATIDDIRIIDAEIGDFMYGGQCYFVLTNDEAEVELIDTLWSSLWSLEPALLARCTGFDVKVFTILCDALGSEANWALIALVKQTDGFAKLKKAVVRKYGRGHFLATYDGQEHCYEIDGQKFFIYRAKDDDMWVEC